MWSPLVHKIQMMLMHRFTSEKPPPLLHLADGGIIEILGVVALLRRKLRLIVVSDACQDPQLSLRSLTLAIKMATEERLCSFYDCRDELRNIDYFLDEFADSADPVLEIGILYESECREKGQTYDKEGQSKGKVLYVRTRLLKGDDRPLGGLITPAELEESFRPVAAEAGKRQPRSESTRLHTKRADLGGFMCECCHSAPLLKDHGKFPNINTGNPFLTRTYFSELCRLGCELSGPITTKLKRLDNSG